MTSLAINSKALSACAIALVLLIWSHLPASEEEFHTSPFCWEKIRIYASGSTKRVQVSIEKIDPVVAFTGTVSPNGAYLFDITGRVNDSDRDWMPHLTIFNERPYLLEFQFPSTKSISKAEWITENLILVRLWWGRAAGSDFIVDVEKEEIIYQQPIRWGDSAFEQYKQCAEEESKDELQCQCSAHQVGDAVKPGGGDKEH